MPLPIRYWVGGWLNDAAFLASGHRSTERESGSEYPEKQDGNAVGANKVGRKPITGADTQQPTN